MPIPGLLHGLELGLATEVANARKQARSEEDDQFNKQLTLLDMLRKDPRTTPELYQKVMEDTLKLHKGQSSTRKPSKGAAGFLGRTDTGPYASDVLKAISSGELPVFSDPRMFEEARQGHAEDALSHVTQQAPFKSSTPTPPPPQPIASQAPAATTPQGLSAPPAPPQGPMPSPPGTAPMLGAATELAGQVAQSGPIQPSFEDSVTVKPPPAQRGQSAFFSPFQMAEMEGNAAGVKAGAISEAQKAALISTLQAAGATPDEIKQAIIENVGGRKSATPDRAPGLYLVPGNPNPIEGFVIEDRGRPTGFRVVDRQGIELPPNAVPTRQETPGTDQKDYEEYLRQAKTQGFKPLDFPKWQEWMANLRQRAAGLTRNGAGFTGPQQFTALTRLQDQWRKASAPYTTMINQYNLMQQGMDEAHKGNMNAGSQAVLVTFQKILDPNSVVRESEYARSPEGLSLIARIQGGFERLKSGGVGMRIEDLEGFALMGQSFLTGLKNSLDPVRAQLSDAANLAGIDEKLIFGNETGLPDVNGARAAGQGVPNAPPAGLQQFLDQLNKAGR